MHCRHFLPERAGRPAQRTITKLLPLANKAAGGYHTDLRFVYPEELEVVYDA
jgi:hypothetical protein